MIFSLPVSLSLNRPLSHLNGLFMSYSVRSCRLVPVTLLKLRIRTNAMRGGSEGEVICAHIENHFEQRISNPRSHIMSVFEFSCEKMFHHIILRSEPKYTERCWRYHTLHFTSSLCQSQQKYCQFNASSVCVVLHSPLCSTTFRLPPILVILCPLPSLPFPFSCVFYLRLLRLVLCSFSFSVQLSVSMVNYKFCPSCGGRNFVATRRCRHPPCSHIFISGPRRERGQMSRRDRSTPRPPASTAGAAFPIPIAPPPRRRRPRGSRLPSSSSSVSSPVPLPPSADVNQDTCAICHDTGKLLCCDDCELAYHLDCAGLLKIPKGRWACPRCQAEKAKVRREGEKTGQGGEGGDTGVGGGSANGLEGLDGSQHSLWEQLEQDKGEEVEVDGLTFTLYPAPTSTTTSTTTTTDSRQHSTEEKEREAKEEEKTLHHMQDEMVA